MIKLRIRFFVLNLAVIPCRLMDYDIKNSPAKRTVVNSPISRLRRPTTHISHGTVSSPYAHPAKSVTASPIVSNVPWTRASEQSTPQPYLGANIENSRPSSSSRLSTPQPARSEKTGGMAFAPIFASMPKSPLAPANIPKSPIAPANTPMSPMPTPVTAKRTMRALPSPSPPLAKKSSAVKKEPSKKIISDEDIARVKNGGYLKISPELWDYMPRDSRIKYVTKGDDAYNARWHNGGYVDKLAEIKGERCIVIANARNIGYRPSWYKTFVVKYSAIEEIWKEYARPCFIETFLTSVSLAEKKRQIMELSAKYANLEARLFELEKAADKRT